MKRHRAYMRNPYIIATAAATEASREAAKEALTLAAISGTAAAARLDNAAVDAKREALETLAAVEAIAGVSHPYTDADMMKIRETPVNQTKPLATKIRDALKNVETMRTRTQMCWHMCEYMVGDFDAHRGRYVRAHGAVFNFTWKWQRQAAAQPDRVPKVLADALLCAPTSPLCTGEGVDAHVEDVVRALGDTPWAAEMAADYRALVAALFE